MDDYLAEPLAQPRLNALLMAALGFAALALAAIGLFGIMASAVRTEISDTGYPLSRHTFSTAVRAILARWPIQ